jgi:hypothetical protein
MTKRSILVAVAFAMLVTGVSNSSSFARNAAAGPGAAGPGAAGPGAAGPGSSSGGGSSGSGGGGGAGGSGAHVLDAAIVGIFPPRVRKPVIYHPPVVVQVLRDARCALGPTELGYFGPERVMLTQICANQL